MSRCPILCGEGRCDKVIPRGKVEVGGKKDLRNITALKVVEKLSKNMMGKVL